MAIEEVKMKAVIFLGLVALCVADQSFTIDYERDTFLMNGKPFRYVSGSIHYQRVPHQYWEERLSKMAAAGLNAIQTYVAWNGHEMTPGKYDLTSGQQDIRRFLQLAQAYNLSVILRPGPYICAEWEFGGFPAWLLNYPDIKLRTMDKNYIKAVDSWLTVLYTAIKPYLFKNGGPIITVQIENEYGSYSACDNNYMMFLRDKARTLLGNDVVLFTTDGDGDGYLKCGTVSGVYATVDFGPTNDPEKNFAIQRHKEPHGPLVNSEFYTGWLDHWGEEHSVVDKQRVADSLDKMLALGANVNMYMFEGGTNFAFWNGAEYSPYKAIPTSYDYDAPLSESGDITGKYLLLREVISKFPFTGANYPYGPVPTSYDYNAPLTEAGDITDKYMKIRSVIGKYRVLPKLDLPPNTPKKAYGKVDMSLVETVQRHVEDLPNVTSVYPLNMEKLNHYYGFLMYEHVLTEDVVNGKLDLSGVRDRAYVSVGTRLFPKAIGVVERDTNNTTLLLMGKKGYILFILVENQGRINYGSQINYNTKGLIKNVTLNGQILRNWVHFPERLENLDNVVDKAPARSLGQNKAIKDSAMTLPAYYIGYLQIEGLPADTYIDMSEWTKGQIYLNGKNMGRYWPKMGPQVRLYIPKFALKSGNNTLVLMELEKSPCAVQSRCFVDLKDTPLINGTVPTYGADNG